MNEQEAGAAGRQPTEEELRTAMEEQMRRLRVQDVVLQTVATLVNLAGQKLSVEGAKDAAEAQRAIDAARHMIPLVPEEAKRPIQNALDQVQLLYVRETQGASSEGQEQPPKDEPPAASKIWTPGS